MEVTFELRLNNELDDSGLGRELQTSGVAKHRQCGGGGWGDGMWSDLTETQGIKRSYLQSTYYMHALFLIYKCSKTGIVIPLTDEKIFISEKLSNVHSYLVVSGDVGSQVQLYLTQKPVFFLLYYYCP